MNTHSAAEKMLSTGLFYTARMLGHAFGESQKDGNRSIENIKKNSRYEIIAESHPVNKIKVVAIDGRRITIEQLQNTALLFKRPSLLIRGRT
ncbi:hypothetical protein JFJ09_07325 [Pseudoalteromonas arctica]|uniref:hypothetical protein n=1 Tax=Pseudoalteromonas arctica TaxID=394751 RepID=UPI001C9BCBDC|nr:hypothetical protein [Pseudoalteromonas arctica]MBZ2192026.1 hypothetical protein [Pseudoalteromonas arctica]